MTAPPGVDPVAFAEAQAEAFAKRRQAEEAAKPQPWKFSPIDSRTFMGNDYKAEWLIERTLVKGEVCIIGGPMKCFKTSIALDMAASLAGEKPFLGRLKTYTAPKRVMVLSGESGGAALQDAFRRICKAKALDPSALPVHWQFDLPAVANPADRLELSDGLAKLGADVLILDPLYLCLLTGVDDADPANLYKMGPLLNVLAMSCRRAKVTPILLHHSTKTAGRTGEPIELDDLSYSGTPQFAAQWMLLNRRRRTAPGDPFELWMNAGGRMMDPSLWAIDIDEGVQNAKFTGRHWNVEIRPGGEEYEARKEQRAGERKKKKAEEAQEDCETMLRALDGLSGGGPVTESRLRAVTKWRLDKLKRIITQLKNDKFITEYTAQVPGGRGSKQDAQAFRRVDEA